MISAIRTERLNVRRVTADDWRAIQGIWADRAATAYAKYDKPVDTSDAAVLSRIEKWSSFADSEEHMFFAVCLDAFLIGYIAFNRRAEGYEIGYCFHSAFHRKGYAKESISGILSALRQEGVRFVSAGTALDNTPSVRLLESLGFELTEVENVSFYSDAHGQPIYFRGGVFELHM